MTGNTAVGLPKGNDIFVSTSISDLPAFQEDQIDLSGIDTDTID